LAHDLGPEMKNPSAIHERQVTLSQCKTLLSLIV
jgi:hypothetical protein